MIITDLSKEFYPMPKNGQKSGQKCAESTVKSGQKKKHKQTKACEIPKDVKKVVWERDGHRCIFCHKVVPIECACCHFIPRSQGGLGIPQNIYTGCQKCHGEQDNGLNTLQYEQYLENYLKSIYGAEWNKDKLIYKKWR